MTHSDMNSPAIDGGAIMPSVKFKIQFENSMEIHAMERAAARMGMGRQTLENWKWFESTIWNGLNEYCKWEYGIWERQPVKEVRK